MHRTVHQTHGTVNQTLPKTLIENVKQSYLEDYSIIIIGPRPPISCHVSPICQNIVIPKTNRFSEKGPDHNRQSCRQHDFLYYQPQPSIHNHSQQYPHYIIVQQASLKMIIIGTNGKHIA